MCPENAQTKVLMMPGCHEDRLCLRSEELAQHREAIANLKAWEKKQNGALERLEDKVDQLKLWMMGALLGSLLAVVTGLLRR
jgi:hypothetical protein